MSDCSPDVFIEDENVTVTIEETDITVIVEQDDITVTVVEEPVTVSVEDNSTVIVVEEETTTVLTVGEQGPPGATGPEGPEGPQGPPGNGSDSVALLREAAINLSGHRAVTPRVDGTIDYADPATIGNRPVWITTQAIDQADLGSVVAYGEIIEGTWSWSLGNVYLGAAGFLTQVEPTSGALVIVGVAVNPTTIFVDRQLTIEL